LCDLQGFGKKRLKKVVFFMLKSKKVFVVSGI